MILEMKRNNPDAEVNMQLVIENLKQEGRALVTNEMRTRMKDDVSEWLNAN